MSDFGLYVTNDYLEEDFIQNNNQNVKNEEKDVNERKIKIIKVIFWILLIFSIGEFVGYKFVMPLFKSPKVTIGGNKLYSAEELAVMLLPMDSGNFLKFDCNQAAAILSSEPGIEKVSVYKKFPDKIYINVTEREPVALTFVEENGSTSLVQIDRNGVLFPERKSTIQDISLIPILSGIPVEYMAGGMKIPNKYKPLIEQISRIRNLPQKYFAAISEICVINKDTGNYELEIVPSQSRVKVLTDRALNEESFKYMMLVLDVVNQLNTDVSEVDLRYGSVSYRTNRGL